MIRKLPLLLLAMSALVLVGCGEDNKVGSDKLRDFESQGGEGALGGTTTTAKPAVADTTTPPQTTAKPTATTAKATATTAPATTVAPSITVKIQGDGQGNAFEPSNTRAFRNSIIRFQNVDSAAHEVKARNGEFASPSIPPGGVWDYKITIAPGNYEYTDLSRPYAVGYLEVLAR